jgi:hypothetical protein
MHDNQDLRYELDMYKSVADSRPRTGLTRVARVPLSSHSVNGKPLIHSTLGAKYNLENIEEADVRSGDLTIADLG